MTNNNVDLINMERGFLTIYNYDDDDLVNTGWLYTLIVIINTVTIISTTLYQLSCQLSCCWRVFSSFFSSSVTITIVVRMGGMVDGVMF